MQRNSIGHLPCPGGHNMNILEQIKKQLTDKEYRGYLKGNILAIRMNLTSNLSPTELLDALSQSEHYEKELQKETRRVEAEAQRRLEQRKV